MEVGTCVPITAAYTRSTGPLCWSALPSRAATVPIRAASDGMRSPKWSTWRLGDTSK
jgi:hypothetical protein